MLTISATVHIHLIRFILVSPFSLKITFDFHWIPVKDPLHSSQKSFTFQSEILYIPVRNPLHSSHKMN